MERSSGPPPRGIISITERIAGFPCVMADMFPFSGQGRLSFRLVPRGADGHVEVRYDNELSAKDVVLTFYDDLEIALGAAQAEGKKVGEQVLRGPTFLSLSRHFVRTESKELFLKFLFFDPCLDSRDRSSSDQLTTALEGLSLHNQVGPSSVKPRQAAEDYTVAQRQRLLWLNSPHPDMHESSQLQVSLTRRRIRQLRFQRRIQQLRSQRRIQQLPLMMRPVSAAELAISALERLSISEEEPPSSRESKETPLTNEPVLSCNMTPEELRIKTKDQLVHFVALKSRIRNSCPKCFPY